MTVTVSQSQSAQQSQPKTRNRHFPTILGSTKTTGFNKETPRENRMSWVQIPLARQTKKPGISTILGFFFYPTAKRFIRLYPMTVEPIWPCGLRDFCDVGTPPASQFDSMRHRFPLPNLKWHQNTCNRLCNPVGGSGLQVKGVELQPRITPN